MRIVLLLLAGMLAALAIGRFVFIQPEQRLFRNTFYVIAGIEAFILTYILLLATLLD